VTEGLNKIGKEMVNSKQDAKTQIEVKEVGISTLAQLSARDGSQTEPVNTQFKETMQLRKSKEVEGLGSGEFPLTTFDEKTGVKTVSHLQKLGEFYNLRGVQQKELLGGEVRTELLREIILKLPGRRSRKVKLKVLWKFHIEQDLTLHLHVAPAV
jgi:hypothetical protein